MIQSRYRETCLIETNLRWLRQIIELLERMSGDSYVRKADALGAQSIGPQVRHIVEFYESFLKGLQSRRIDYGARKRDRLIEINREAAVDRLRGLSSQLLAGAECGGDCALWIRVEDSALNTYVMSSASRELQELSSHTVHHLALIAMIARMLGLEVDPDLGVSPSTMAHRKAQEMEMQDVHSELAAIV